MAEAFPSVILDSVLKQLEKSPIFRSNKLHIRLHNPLIQLRSQLEIIRYVIDEAELMGFLFPDHAVGKTVCELQNVLYEVDDLLDEVLTRSMPLFGVVEKVRRHVYQLSFGLTLAPEIKKINTRLDGILNELYKCNLIPTTPVGKQDKLVARKGILRYNPDHVRDDDFQMIGRDDDKKKVIKMLFDEVPRVVVIHGDAGVGKTTLCRAVYSDEEVSNHFESVLWVGGFIAYSPTDFLERIARKLGVDGPYYSDTGYSDISKTKRDLEEKISTKLNETDILLILDDVPTDILDSMKVLLSFLCLPRPRSRILMSSSGECYFLGNILAYKMDDLSEVDMLSLFEKTAFGSSCCRGTQWFPEGQMRDLVKEIVWRCPGNPSLLKGVATLLCEERDMNVWQKFAREFDFERQYRLYNEIHKKFEVAPKCQHNLGYLSLFSTVEFKFDDLIHQFAAHRYTPLSNTGRELLKKFLYYSAEGMCTVDEDHRDFIVQLAGAESKMLGCTDTTDVHQVARRHVSISSSSVQQQNGKLPDGLLKDATHRRSLLLFGDDSVPAVIRVQTLSVLFSHLRNLRVLSLQDLRLRVLPNSIGRLIHLKYLDLSGNNFVELPASVCTLALWTLKLTYCSELKSFPPQITNLRTLKHLEIDMCFDLIYMPSRIAQLTGLESLDRFVVGSRKGGLRYLENLNKLNGHLSIELPRRWKNYAEDIKQANLRGKTALASLEFKWHGAHNDNDGNDYDVLEQLKPCTSTQKLSFVNYRGPDLPKWFTSFGLESRTLTEISLCRCARCEILPPFQSMPKLKSLTLVSLDHIQYILQNDNGNDVVSPDLFFPSLRVLKIGKMPVLRGWSRDLNSLPRFQDMEIVQLWQCPSLEYMPPFSWVSKELVLDSVSVKLLQSIDWKWCRALIMISIANMVSLPIHFLTKRSVTLKIKDCCNLQMLSANEVEGTYAESSSEGFQGIWYLSIENCPEMKNLSSSLRYLTELHQLEIRKCSEELDFLCVEDDIPWETMQELWSLKIEGFEDLIALPKALQHFPRLLTLEIINCKRLVRGLNSLAQLKRLTIKSCPLLSRSIEEFKTENPDARLVVE